MEPNNLQVKIAKKFWQMVRVAIFMLKKSFSKTKLLADLNLMMKRGKIAGKAIHNLMYGTHHHHHTPTTAILPTKTTGRHVDEYEFSCSNTPTHHFNIFKRKNHHHQILSASQSPVSDEVMTADAVTMALEMMSATATPVAYQSSMMRELRITDSPFPLNNGNDEDNEVDGAADEFIKKFYKNLRKQNLIVAA